MGVDPYLLEDSGAAEAPKVEISRYWKALKKRWWLVMIIATVVTVPWVIYVKQEPPIYEAATTIRYTNYAGNSENIMSARFQQFNSRSFYERVVSELGLVLTIEQQDDQDVPLFRKQLFAKFTSGSNPFPGRYVLRFPGDGTFSLHQMIAASGREIELRRGNIATAAADTIAVNGFSFQLANNPAKFPRQVFFEIGNFRNKVKSLQERIRLDMARDGSMVEVALQDSDPYVVTQTVNSLANIVVKESQGIGEGSVEDQRKILQTQVDKAKTDLDASNEKLKFAKQRLTSGSDLAFREKLTRRDGLDREVNDLKNYRESLRSLLGKLSTLPASTTNGSATEILNERRRIFNAMSKNRAFENDMTMSLDREHLEELEKQWTTVVSQTSLTHPEALKLQRDIENLHGQMQENARLRMQTLDSEIQQKQSELSRLNAILNQLPSEGIELTNLERENQLYANTYNNLLADLRKLQLDKAAKTEFIEILDPAIEPELPINSNKKARAAGGGAFGLILGIMFVLVWEMMDRTIKSVDDIKGYLRLNVLGAIPQVAFDNVNDFQDHEKAKMMDQQLVTHDFAPTPIGEAYRSLRTSIIYNKKTGRLQTLVLTSTAPGDGKSFTAANLGIALAQQKSKTLLVDTDLRRGVQHNTFGVPKEPGFSNYLCGQVIGADIINETHIPNLAMISCGALVPNPSELLGSLQMRRFLDEMRRKFDVIIFDTPPLNAATDAVVIGTQVDGVAIVVRAGKTHREIARQKLELFQNLEAKIIGVILNGTSVDLAHEGYSYYHY
jgi:capsular exopolysaccharide synthesis family protein